MVPTVHGKEEITMKIEIEVKVKDQCNYYVVIINGVENWFVDKYSAANFAAEYFIENA